MMELSPEQKRHLAKAALWFTAGTALTAVFVWANAGLYASGSLLALSIGIAGGKWALQILAALLLPGGPRTAFIDAVGRVCGIGSALLFVWLPLARLGLDAGTAFVAAVAVSVGYMIPAYYRAAVRSGAGVRWFLAWFLCLCIAVTLQLTVVFGVL